MDEQTNVNWERNLQILTLGHRIGDKKFLVPIVVCPPHTTDFDKHIVVNNN